MTRSNMIKSLPPVLGVGWCVAVMAAYYGYNYLYYYEKIAVFGKFFLGVLE